MQTIVIASQKGGSSKTTTATCLSVALPGKVALLDTDPQGSAAMWADLRKRNGFTPTPGAIRAEVADLGRLTAIARKNGADWLIIDTVGTSNAGLIETVRFADIVISPTRIDAPDIAAMRSTIKLIKPSGRPHFIVLTCIRAGMFGFQRRENRAGTAIEAVGGVLAPVRIFDRLAFPEALATGRVVREQSGGEKVASQIDALAEFIMSKVGVLA